MNVHVEHVEDGLRMNAHVEQGEREREIGELKTLAAEVGQVAYDVHHYFGNGLLEKVYESALTHRLEKMGYFVERQKPLNVFDEDGYCVGEYFADMVVDGKLIVELKAVVSLTTEHLSQVMNYLKIANFPLGLLLNFGAFKYERRTVYAPIRQPSIIKPNTL